MNFAEQTRLIQLYEFESQLYEQGALFVAGIDEVGRGSVAGPLTVCACVLRDVAHIEYLNDSKKLTAKRRDKVSQALKDAGAIYSIAHVDVETIDHDGISSSLRDAMRIAVADLPVRADTILLDGNPLGLGVNEQSIVKGDEKIACIAAASVIAKVTRDNLMIELDEKYPEYEFASNKGYASAAHIQAIKKHGLSPVHRVSFCSNFLENSLF